MNGERKLAMFMDFENIARGVKEAQYKQFELKLVLERLLEKGKIIVRRAYADWNRFTEYKRPFHEWAIELIDVPQSRYSGKNSADIRMVVDALDLAYGKTHIDSFVLVSGDSDFSPLVSKLRENDRYVIGLGVKSSSSDLLVANCDEFIFYEDLIRDTKKTRLLSGLPEKKAEAMAQLIDAIQALQRENKETLWGSMVKQTMIRKNPAFNETYYGYSTFSKLLEDAAKQKIVTLERDEKSGTYIITSLTEEGAGRPDGRRPAFPAACAAPGRPRQRMRASRPLSLTKAVSAQLTTEITSAPSTAGQKPSTSQPADQPRRHHQAEGVEHQEEQAQRQQRERERQDHQHGPHERVDQSEHEAGHQECPAPSAEMPGTIRDASQMAAALTSTRMTNPTATRRGPEHAVDGQHAGAGRGARPAAS